MLDYQEYDEWSKSLPSGKPRGKWKKEYNDFWQKQFPHIFKDGSLGHVQVWKKPGEEFDCVNGEILRVACGFTRDKQYVLLINMKGQIRYKRWYHHWGDEIIAHYEEIR